MKECDYFIEYIAMNDFKALTLLEVNGDYDFNPFMERLRS
jgi:hypothetical protein